MSSSPPSKTNASATAEVPPGRRNLLDDSTPTRRSFFYRAATFALGTVLFLPPLVAGLMVFFDPLRRKLAAKFVRVANLDAVPDDGRPHLFQVITDRVDAWSRHSDEPVGAVYLVRKPGDKTPVAFSATCPHAGCFVGLADSRFQCPCHTSAFAFDGRRIGGAASVSPRDLDRLTVEVRPVAQSDGKTVEEVLVNFQRFQTGSHEQIPIA